MAWTIEYSDAAVRELRKFGKPRARRVLDCMDERVALREDPRNTGKALTGPLGGLWRYRIGDCRVVCQIHDAVLTVLVAKIGNHKKVYL